MTTNLYAIAGPSKPASVGTTSSPSPRSEAPSPLKTISLLPEDPSSAGGGIGGVNKNGLSLDDNGEVLKVPAFLNKLFTMVSDPEVDELIYWGENGDSFFVPNAEHFGRELLPRWFKHSNFSSFVRQLNMYGFHKVPHLQSGALKNETPLELWEFANPFFKRGQPKLLAKVTRKNNRPGAPPPSTVPSGAVNTRAASQAAVAPSLPSTGKYLITDGTVEGEAGPLVGPAGQVADLNAIHNGIAAIRQTQANIGAELRKLQSSNEALWRQAYETQEKQGKHEDTINLIVSFLERLFGTEGEGLKGLKEAMRRGGVGGRPREDSATEETGSAKKRRRVGLDRMISDGKVLASDPDLSDDDDRLVEIGSSSQYSMPPYTRSGSASKRSTSTTPTDNWASSAQRFTTLPTEEESTPSTRAASKPPITPGQDQTLGVNHLSPLSDSENLLPSDNNALARYNAMNGNFNSNSNTSGDHGQPLFSPSSAEAAASAFNLDPSLLQTTIGSLLQSPAAAQMFLNSLNSSSQGQALSTPNAKLPPPNQPSFPFDAPRMPQTNVDPNMDPTLALFTPLPNQDALMSHSGNLLKSYQDAASINGGLDQLQESIDSMVRSMGLDLPANTGDIKPDVGGMDGNALMGIGNGSEQLVDPDFNVDEFLEHLAKSEEVGGGDGTGLAGLQGAGGLMGGGNGNGTA
ncbi:hypothetical protein IAR55_000619 [Kwoniella newhampshirensis]|uniref:HSF-type DNA-binding domain-containing protein n=1 Tax=Kwoniella newhampshirensis TaxID=1651941 RepID=A0AAW0Z7A5_9TREE